MKQKLMLSDSEKSAEDLDLLNSQINEAHERAESFRTDVMRLGEERFFEQQELARLIEELRDQLSVFYTDKTHAQAIESTTVSRDDGKLKHLQMILNQLVATNSEQENLTSELNDRLKMTEKQLDEITSSIDRGLKIVEDYQKKYPALFDQFHAKSIDTQPSSVVEQFVTYIQLLCGKNELQQLKLSNMEKQWTSSMLEHRKQLEQMKREHSAQLQEQRDLFHNEMTNAVSRAEAATSEARDLSLQATNLRSGLEEQLRIKTDTIDKLQKELQLLRMQKQENNQNDREEALRNVLDKTELEAAKLRCERDAASGQCSALTAKLEAAEAHMKELDAQLAQSNALQQLFKQKYEKSKREITKMQTERTIVSRAIKKLNLLLIDRLELNDAVITFPETETADWARIAAEQLNYLAKKLQTKSSLGMQTKRRVKIQGQKLNDLMTAVAQLKVDSDAKERVISTTKNELDQQKADLERVIAERDYYLQVLSEQAEELCTVKADYQRQLKELEKLGRAKARLDELTSQIELLKSTSSERCCGHTVKQRESKGIHRQCQKRIDVVTNKGFQNEPTNEVGSSNRIELTTCRKSLNAVDQVHSNLNITETEFVEEKNSPCGLNESLETFVKKLNGLTKAHTLLEVAKNDLEMARSSVYPIKTTSHPDSERIVSPANQSPDTAPLNLLKHRLYKLELQMMNAANEKQVMQTKNEEMAELLNRLMEQNQKLLKELEDRTSTNAMPDLGPLTSSTFGLPSLQELTGSCSSKPRRPQHSCVRLNREHIQQTQKLETDPQLFQLAQSDGVNPSIATASCKEDMERNTRFFNNRFQYKNDENNRSSRLNSNEHRTNTGPLDNSSPYEKTRSHGTPIPLLTESEPGQDAPRSITDAPGETGDFKMSYRKHLNFDYQRRRPRDAEDASNFEKTESISKDKSLVLSNDEQITKQVPYSLPEPPSFSPTEPLDQLAIGSFTSISNISVKQTSAHNPPVEQAIKQC